VATLAQYASHQRRTTQGGDRTNGDRGTDTHD
jgi:hypothetical protein